ncbi:MAG: thioredoxin family protein [Actinobacteria bacterium]|nr:MAG: thioredoxin family protein [Actinomycetota bacterium]
MAATRSNRAASTTQGFVPLLLFFTTERSGPARRMESLLAHLARKERTRLRIARIDADQTPEWTERLDVDVIPTLVLLKDRKPVERLEGRVSAPQIERMLAPHLDAVTPETATRLTQSPAGRSSRPITTSRNSPARAPSTTR